MKPKKKKYILPILFLSVALVLVLTAPAGEITAKSKPILNKKKVTLKAGSSTRLRLKHNSQKVKWSSSRKKVASVSSRGLVRAKKRGTAKITAKAGGRRYICRVTVRAARNGTRKSEKNAQPNTTTQSQTAVQSQTTAEPQATPEPDQTQTYARQVLELVNKERAAQGLETLTLDTSLCEAAAARAKEITELFSHTRPNGQTCFTILKEYDISYRAVGENIAAGQSTPQNVMQSWMNSEGHRANILSASYNKLGVGYVKSSSGYGNYWVQIFTD